MENKPMYVIEVSDDAFDTPSNTQRYFIKSCERMDVKFSITKENARTFTFTKAVNICSVLNKTNKRFFRPILNEVIFQSKLNKMS
jgi:hypothetical protein